MPRLGIRTLVAVAALAAAPAFAQELARGYEMQSPAGPTIAWIPSYASDYPEITAEPPAIPAEMLAMTLEPDRLQYRPAALDAPGFRHATPEGVELAWVPSAESDPTMPLWLVAAPQDQQLGAVPDEEPEEETVR